jgi:hypothetical protein
MSSTSRQPWSLAKIVITLALLASGALVPSTLVSAQSGVHDELAYGQETGYFFFWDPARLSLQDESSAPGVDHWRLTDGDATVDIWAYSGAGTTTADCVGDALAMIAADPATVSIETLPIYGEGPVEVFGDTFTEIVLTVDLTGEQEKFALKVECQEPLPEQVLVLEIISMPARVYNERGFESVSIGGLRFYLFMDLHDTVTGPVAIPNRNGSVAGTLTGFLACNSRVFDVMARAGNGGEFAVDPASILAIDEAGVSLPVTAVAWSVPDAAQVSSLRLAAGELGLLHGVVDVESNHYFDLYYAAPTGETIFLAPSLWGCGGGGAAPVPIDID